MRRVRWLATVLGVCVVIGAARGEPADPLPTGGRELARAVREAFDSREFSRAAALLRRQLEERPKDPFVMYNLACALAMAGEPGAASETLIDAVAHGFSDLHHAAQDEHLDPIRGERSYLALVKGWRAVLDRRGEADLAGAKEMFGPEYTYERDERLRLNYASAMPAESFAAAKREIERTAAWAAEEIGLGASSDEARPDPWVLIVLPTPQDFAKFISDPAIGGYYDKDRKRLIARDIGPTLRHEFVHVVHWRRMDRLGQRHPYWIMEGLASLVEDVEDAGEGYALAASWRTNIAKRLERLNRLTPWARLFALERDGFMGERARAHYAESRAVLMFLHAEGRLRAWYEAYEASFAEEATGLRAFEDVLDGAGAAEKRYRAWLRGLPSVGEINRPGEASLGVALSAGSGDGPEVAGVVSMSRAKAVGQERLRRKDTITAIDGRTTRSLDEWHRVLSEYSVGEVVRLTVRRGSRVLTVEMELVGGEARP